MVAVEDVPNDLENLRQSGRTGQHLIDVPFPAVSYWVHIHTRSFSAEDVLTSQKRHRCKPRSSGVLIQPRRIQKQRTSETGQARTREVTPPACLDAAETAMAGLEPPVVVVVCKFNDF